MRLVVEAVGVAISSVVVARETREAEGLGCDMATIGEGSNEDKWCLADEIGKSGGAEGCWTSQCKASEVHILPQRRSRNPV